MNDNSSVTPIDGNTGVLPPQGEESAVFENVNMNANANGNENGNGNNSPLGNAQDAVEVPSTVEPAPVITGKAKREQSAAQKKTISSQAEERSKLKSAGVSKPSVAMVATLASMRVKNNPSYNTAFANAVAGKPLTTYRAPKTAKKSRKLNSLGTVLNTTLKKNNNNGATSFMSPPLSVAANARNNNGAAKNTISTIQSMGESAISTVREMMRLSTTLTKELAKTNNTAGLAAALSPLGPLSSMRNRNMTRAKPKKPRASRKKAAASNTGLSDALGPNIPLMSNTAPPPEPGLSTIAEENENVAMTPPP